VPMRPPADMWGFVVVAVHTFAAKVGGLPITDSVHTDTTDLLAGVWLPAPPPVDLHTGDVVVRLQHSNQAPARNRDDRTQADVVVLAPAGNEWSTVRSWARSLGARWPHEVAISTHLHMRYLVDKALRDARWATLTGPITATTPDWLTHRRVSTGRPEVNSPRHAPDGLAWLLKAGMVEVGEKVVFDCHTATIGAGGVLHHGSYKFTVSTVNALATHLSGCTVNGWHLWRRARDNRLLADLRTDLATR